MQNKYIITLLFLVVSFYFPASKTFAQVDTEFWFVAPDVVTIAQGHGDRPVFLRVATFANPTTVTISQPANSSFATITRNISANTVEMIDLSNFIGDIENQPVAQVQNKGILVTSNNPVSVYYEIMGKGSPANNQDFPLNPEIFSLKGKNALGLDFYVLSQDFCYNAFGGLESADIVATENGTNITFIPNTELVGSPSNYQPGTPYNITLNKGQTFALKPTTGNENFSMKGTRISANKPIAVTLSDDSIHRNGSMDLIGDQTFPIEKTGKEYIVVRGLDGASQDRVYILATENNTQISINGANVGTFNAGQTYNYDNLVNQSTYIQANKNVYVMHLTGHIGFNNGIESTSSIIPPLGCSGTSAVNVVRNTVDDFTLLVMTKAGNQGNFQLNGNATLLTSSDFSFVSGTSNQWVFARKTFSNTTLPNNQIISITNSSGIFHLGTLSAYKNSAGNIVGSNYAYFSDFGQFAIDLGANKTICAGQSVILDAGAGTGRTYQWSSNANNATTQTVSVNTAGTYSVTVTQGTCSATAQITVTVNTTTVNLGVNRTICAGQSVTLDAGGGTGRTFMWSSNANNATTQTINVNSAGTYSVTVTQNGCTATSQVQVTVNPLPSPTITQLLPEYCAQSANTSLTSTLAGGIFTINGVNNTVFSPTTLGAGNYVVNYTLTNPTTNCSFFQSQNVRILDANSPLCFVALPIADFFVPDLFSPNQDNKNDAFVVRGDYVNSFEMKIFDRYGNLMFESNDFQQAKTQGWNGKVNDKEQPAGVYFWEIKGKYNNGNDLTYKGKSKGSVKLVR